MSALFTALTESETKEALASMVCEHRGEIKSLKAQIAGLQEQHETRQKAMMEEISTLRASLKARRQEQANLELAVATQARAELAKHGPVDMQDPLRIYVRFTLMALQALGYTWRKTDAADETASQG